MPEEIFSELLSGKNFRVERIVSDGHHSEKDFWYDQDEHEWVLVIQGEAVIEFESRRQTLKPGDYLNIPAHSKHRVAATSTQEKTIWLAIFYR
ncbi:cupin domain-containing protein [Porticoccus sp. W117]|uniref:cupin domain-containing protein n=1 Tax=Porticoccus sp. W117 TaxID=3054777 RepID=UPI002592A2D7|nr:cupin domain-containing protein [Porticoccus sp. W117]MDM3870907.1 cupin domain-containing protein [Porticoccus sp. W117]